MHSLEEDLLALDMTTTADLGSQLPPETTVVEGLHQGTVETDHVLDGGSFPSTGRKFSEVVCGGVEEYGRGKRRKMPSSKLRDYVTNTVKVMSPSPPSCLPPSVKTSGTSFLITRFVNCNRFSLRHRMFLGAITTGLEPRSYKEAMKDKGWRDAMHYEIQALEANGIWELVQLPPGQRALGSRWVYKVKYNSDGSLERLKARLVVFGNHQIEGIDYTDTFAPVAKMTNVRLFLPVVAVKNWELHQMDVHNAFLHGDLNEEVYMKQPPRFQSRTPGLVCKLRKSLYGLKQAPRCWFAKLDGSLKQYGFTQSYSDYSLFIYTQGKIQINILVYVDDLILSSNNHAALCKFKEYMSCCFHMKDLGVLKYFLGVEVARNGDGIYLCQRKYTLDIIAETCLLGSKPIDFRMEQHHQLACSKSSLLEDAERYQRLVGRLIYLSFTRPDLAYSVHILSQFLQAP
ncbi:transmembrane signal receptor [Lithospermum erythrorhizon]|uniref:Transmembrane signal receptor n=1 Tax=Lithospermum erythrorhizon TaxID=34254 RepID=A0AAV3QJB2_LITER